MRVRTLRIVTLTRDSSHNSPSKEEHTCSTTRECDWICISGDVCVRNTMCDSEDPAFGHDVYRQDLGPRLTFCHINTQICIFTMSLYIIILKYPDGNLCTRQQPTLQLQLVVLVALFLVLFLPNESQPS